MKVMNSTATLWVLDIPLGAPALAFQRLKKLQTFQDWRIFESSNTNLVIFKSPWQLSFVLSSSFSYWWHQNIFHKHEQTICWLWSQSRRMGSFWWMFYRYKSKQNVLRCTQGPLRKKADNVWILQKLYVAWDFDRGFKVFSGYIF